LHVVVVVVVVARVTECSCVTDGPIRAGNVFSGTAAWRSCRPWLEHPISYKITGVMTSKLYPSRLGVSVHSIIDVPHEHVRKLFLFCIAQIPLGLVSP